jgi:riboflavin synthase
MVFTDIVEGVGEVQVVASKENFASISIGFPEYKLKDVKIGASVAINGTCLTVTLVSSETTMFDVMTETLRAKTLGTLISGSIVNFERAARVGD